MFSSSSLCVGLHVHHPVMLLVPNNKLNRKRARIGPPTRIFGRWYINLCWSCLNSADMTLQRCLNSAKLSHLPYKIMKSTGSVPLLPPPFLLFLTCFAHGRHGPPCWMTLWSGKKATRPTARLVTRRLIISYQTSNTDIVPRTRQHHLPRLEHAHVISLALCRHLALRFLPASHMAL